MNKFKAKSSEGENFASKATKSGLNSNLFVLTQGTDKKFVFLYHAGFLFVF